MLFSFAITFAKLLVYALLINENGFTVCNKNVKNVSHYLFIITSKKTPTTFFKSMDTSIGEG